MITYTLNELGLRTRDMDYMTSLFATVPAIKKVVLYGSRAMGRFESGSDVDIAIAGNEVTTKDIAHIHFKLENESPTLLWFDVIHYESITNKALKNEIDGHGKIIYAAQ